MSDLADELYKTLTTMNAVRMAEVKTPGRDEATLGEIAQRLGELGEWGMMRSLNAFRERIQTALRMGE